MGPSKAAKSQRIIDELLQARYGSVAGFVHDEGSHDINMTRQKMTAEFGGQIQQIKIPGLYEYPTPQELSCVASDGQRENTPAGDHSLVSPTFASKCIMWKRFRSMHDIDLPSLLRKFPMLQVETPPGL
jgi:hypothetical protein